MNGCSVDLTISDETIDGLPLRVARHRGSERCVPLLIFNGMGVNLEVLVPFMQALDGIASVAFDPPGVGGSPCRPLPLRFSELAALGNELVAQCGFDTVDVLGYSWGGGAAQEFAYRHPHSCRRLILAATSIGMAMIPGDWSVLAKLASPRRYLERDYLRNNAGDLYGGRMRQPELIDEYLQLLRPLRSPLDYYRQLYASAGWTSIHWLHELRQPVLILAGSQDPLLPLENARLMQRHIPACKLIEVDEGHLLLFASRHEVAASIRGFLTADNPL